MIQEQGKLLFTAFIVILVGAVLIGTIGQSVEDVKVATNKVTNESHAVAATITLNYDELTAFDALRNTTAADVIGECNVTLGTGTLQCNATTSDSTWYADYTYTPDIYVRDRATRTIITLVVIFFALAILALAIGYAWKSLKSGGVI